MGAGGQAPRYGGVWHPLLFLSGCIDLVSALKSAFPTSVCRFFVISVRKLHMDFCRLFDVLASGETFESSTPSEMIREYSTMPRGDIRREAGRESRDE